MTNITHRSSTRMLATLMALAVLLAPLAAVGQTRIEAPKNKYSTSDDVKAGQQAAQQTSQFTVTLIPSVIGSSQLSRRSFSTRSSVTHSTWLMRATSTPSLCRAARCSSIEA